MLKALSSNGIILGNILKEKNHINMIIDDHDIIRVAVKSNGLALQYASDRLKDSMEIVEKAVIQNGLALQYASDRLKDNKIIVNTAIKQNGLALQYVSDRFKSRLKIVIRALKQNGLALQYVPEYIQMRAIDITGVAIRNNISAINYSTIKLNDLPRISFLIHNYNVELIKYVDYDIKNNYHVILYCVKQNGLLLEFASEKLKINKDIVLAAIKQNLLAYTFIGSSFRANSEIIFYIFFKQRNLLFLLDHNFKCINSPEELNKLNESYPLYLNYEYNDNKLINYLYNILLDIYVKERDKIPKSLAVKIIKLLNIDAEKFNIIVGDIMEYFIRSRRSIYPDRIQKLILIGSYFFEAITNNNYIKTYFKLMMKCCLKVSNYYENSTDKNEALLNVKNYPILQQNEFYRYIGLIKELKDTVLSKSGLLKLLLKKICIKLNDDDKRKSKMIHNLIIKSSINRKMINNKLQIIEDINYYNAKPNLEI